MQATEMGFLQGVHCVTIRVKASAGLR